MSGQGKNDRPASSGRFVTTWLDHVHAAALTAYRTACGMDAGIKSGMTKDKGQENSRQASTHTP